MRAEQRAKAAILLGPKLFSSAFSLSSPRLPTNKMIYSLHHWRKGLTTNSSLDRWKIIYIKNRIYILSVTNIPIELLRRQTWYDMNTLQSNWNLERHIHATNQSHYFLYKFWNKTSKQPINQPTQLTSNQQGVLAISLWPHVACNLPKQHN